MPEEAAIINRAKRDGSKTTLEAIRRAYAGYNYLLMDQLILGLAMAQKEERAAAAQQAQQRTAATPAPATAEVEDAGH